MVNFKKGDLVWAKFDDFCHWPARIAAENIQNELLNIEKFSKGKIAVLFFGSELSYALVEPSCICDYHENYQKFLSNDDSEDFITSLNQANDSKTIVDPPLEIYNQEKISIIKPSYTEEVQENSLSKDEVETKEIEKTEKKKNRKNLLVEDLETNSDSYNND